MQEFEANESWNMAQAYYNRIDNILTACARYHAAEDPINWFKSLKLLYMEVHAKLGKAKDEAEDKLKAATDEVLPKIGKKNIRIHTKALIDLELFLREQMESKGMLTPKGDDPTSAYRRG